MSTTDIDKETKSSGPLTFIVAGILLIIPLGLWFSYVYSPDGSILTYIMLFLGAVLLGFLANMFFYKMVTSNSSKKIERSQMYTIMGTTASSFMILFLTMFALGVNPKLITIFENTIGIWFVTKVMGNQGFFNTVFKSDIFDELSEHNDENIFDYTFILSRLNDKNIGQFVEYYKKTIDEIKGTTNGVDLPFDFKSNFKDEGQLIKLSQMVETKRTVGYFTWYYLTSAISLMVSIIAMTMKV